MRRRLPKKNLPRRSQMPYDGVKREKGVSGRVYLNKPLEVPSRIKPKIKENYKERCRKVVREIPVIKDNPVCRKCAFNGVNPKMGCLLKKICDKPRIPLKK